MSAGFGWETLKKALAGLPVWDLHHTYITEWIERYLPAAPDSQKGIDRAAYLDRTGSGEQSSEEEAPSTTPPAPSLSQRRAGATDGAASEEVAHESDTKRETDERHKKTPGTDGTIRR
jgi:hypothetical protein